MISYGDKLWFKDVDNTEELEESPEGVLGAIDLE